MKPRRLWLVLVCGAALAAAVASTYLAFKQTYSSHVSVREVPLGATAEEGERGLTLGEASGSGLHVALLVPIALTLVPLLGRSPTPRSVLTWWSALLLLAFSVLGAFTVGTFYLPAAGLLLLAGAASVLAVADDLERRSVTDGG